MARQTPTSPEPEILQKIIVGEYEKQVGDQYWNHSKNLMLSTVF